MSDRKNPPEQDIQGEGDKRSARKFNEKEQEFVREHDTEELGRKAQPADREEQEALERAEEEAAKRAKEHDPDEVRPKGSA
jgi:hypothetical protein